MSALSVQQLYQLADEHGDGIPSELILAVITEESGGQPDVVSSAGAVGLMQIMPQFHPEANLYDPSENVRIGCAVLASDFYYLNHRRASIMHGAPWSDYPWSVQDYTYRALAGYNMGPGNVVWYDNHSDKQWPSGVMRYCEIIWALYRRKAGY